MYENKEKIVQEFKRKKRIKLFVILTIVIGLPLTLFLILFFALGGKERYDNKKIIEANFKKIFIEKNSLPNKDNFTNEGWDNLLEINKIYALGIQDKLNNVSPIYSKDFSVVSQSIKNSSQKSVEAYIVNPTSFKKGTGLFSKWFKRIIFFMKNSKINKIIYEGEEG